MNEFERKKLENDFRNFTTRNFESPSACRDLHQIRFYVKELCIKIREYESRFHFVPSWAFALLAQYNQAQNSLIYGEFRKAYC